MSLRRVFRNIASNYALSGSTGLISLVLTPLLFHHLGPADYAILAFALVIVTVLEGLDLGVTNTLLRYVSKYLEEGSSSEVEPLVSSSFYILLGTGVAFSAILALLSPFLARYFNFDDSHAARNYLPLALVGSSLAFQLPCAALRGFLMGRQDFHLANAVDLLVQWSRGAAIIVGLYAGIGLLGVSAIFPSAALLRMAGLLTVTRISRSFLPKWREAKRDSLRRVLGFASYSFWTQIVSSLFMQSDTLIAAKLLSLPQFAVWVIARRLPLGVNAISHQSLLVSFPITSSTIARRDAQETERLFLLLTRTLLAVVLPIAALLYIWGDIILHLWIGPEVSSGVPVLRAFVVYIVSTGIFETAYIILSGVGRIRFAAFLTTGMLALSITFGPWTCRSAGPTGLAVFYAIVMSCGTVALLGHALGLSGVRLRRWVTKAVRPALFPALLCAAWFYFAHWILPATLWSLSISLPLGVAIFYALFERQIKGVRPQGWKARVRRLLVEV